MSHLFSRRHVLAAAATLIAAPAVRNAQAQEPLLLRCSLETVPSHTRNGIIRDYLGKLEAAAGGRIRTQLFESGQLFPDLQVGKALRLGQIEMGLPGSFALTGLIPDADFLQLPSLYGRPLETVHRVIDGRPGQLIAQQVAGRLNAHVLGPWLDLGFFNWYSTTRPLNSYADLKGLKIRNNGGAGQAWRTQFMGAVPNTTPLPNVALALSQGTFDGLITSNETIASAQFWESGIRHGLEDQQFSGEYVPIVSLAFWHKLTPELQGQFTGIWRDNISAYRGQMAAAQARARDTLQQHGIKIVVPVAAELAAKRLDMAAHQDQVAKLSGISTEMIEAVAAELGSIG